MTNATHITKGKTKMNTGARQAFRIAELEQRQREHEQRYDKDHADVMRFMGATQEYITTSKEDRQVMFQGIADLTQLIGTTREKVAVDDGKAKNNRQWINALVIIFAAVIGSGVMAWLESAFHLIH